MTPILQPNLAAIYRRVSTDHQDGSLALQEQRVNDYAAFKGLTVSEGLAFSDPDTSGSIAMAERHGGRALMNRLGLGDVKHLIVAKIDRLGRNVRDALGVLEYCEGQGIVLHIADFGGDAISFHELICQGGEFMLIIGGKSGYVSAAWNSARLGRTTRPSCFAKRQSARRLVSITCSS